MEINKKELKNIRNKQLPITLKEILNSNIQIGEQIPLARNIIWGDLHSTLNAAAKRKYHNQILLRYLNDESLHKNDIVYLSINE